MDPASWVDEHGDALFRFAMPRVRKREVAEELVQETFLAALRAKDTFAGMSSERTWLIAILRRKVVDHLRARRAATVGRDVPSGARPHVPPSARTDPPDEGWFDKKGKWKVPVARWPADPGALAANKDFRAVLDNCLSKLPSALLESFTLREAEQMETADICKVLGLTASNLWTQLHRARMLLRRCLELNWFSGEKTKRV